MVKRDGCAERRVRIREMVKEAREAERSGDGRRRWKTL